MSIFISVGLLVAFVFKPGYKVGNLPEKQNSPTPPTAVSPSPNSSSENNRISLRLSVIDEDKKGIKDVLATVWSNGSPLQYDFSDDKGYVEFQEIPVKSSQVELTLEKDGYYTLKLNKIDVNADQKFTLTKKASSPQPSVAPSQPSPEPSQSPSPQPSVAPSQPSPEPSQSPSPQPPPSPSVPKANRQSNLPILDNFEIEIFFLSRRQDLEDVALSIKNKLSDYGLTNVRLRPSSVNTFRFDLGGCHWSNIRYDTGEKNAAIKLKSVVEKVALNQTWYLHNLNNNPSEITTNYISVFIEDEDTFSEIYSMYGTNVMYQRESHCVNNRR